MKDEAIEISNVYEGPCDKCNQPVDPQDNAVYWVVANKAIRNGQDPIQALQDFADNPFNLLMYGARHLNSSDSCEGSPSRASQALEGMVSYHAGERLPREEWRPQQEEYADAARQAYSLIQKIKKIEHGE